MNKLTRVALGTLVSAGLLAGAVGTTFAADPTPTPQATPRWGWQRGGTVGFGRGFGYQTMSDSLSKLLGLTAEQIHAERLAGKSLVQIAKAKGKSEADVVSALLAARKKALDDLVKSGKLTREQADQAYKTMEQRIKSGVTRTEIGPNRPDGQGLGLGPGGGKGRGNAGPGMFNRWGQQPPASR